MPGACCGSLLLPSCPSCVAEPLGINHLCCRFENKCGCPPPLAATPLLLLLVSGRGVGPRCMWEKEKEKEKPHSPFGCHKGVTTIGAPPPCCTGLTKLSPYFNGDVPIKIGTPNKFEKKDQPINITNFMRKH